MALRTSHENSWFWFKTRPDFACSGSVADQSQWADPWVLPLIPHSHLKQLTETVCLNFPLCKPSHLRSHKGAQMSAVGSGCSDLLSCSSR